VAAFQVWIKTNFAFVGPVLLQSIISFVSSDTPLYWGKLLSYAFHCQRANNDAVSYRVITGFDIVYRSNRCDVIASSVLALDGSHFNTCK